MRLTLKSALFAAVLLLGPSFAAAPSMAEPLVSKDDRVVLIRSEQAVDDAIFALEQAILGKGLVIDYKSHVGDMLERTGKDVGSSVKLFDRAEIFVFCSASLSRAAMEEDIASVGLCPYSVFAFAHPGEKDVSYVGYRRLSKADMAKDSALRKVDALLQEIAEEAAGG